MKKKMNIINSTLDDILYCSYSIQLLNNLLSIYEFRSLLIISKKVNLTLLDFIKKIKYNDTGNQLIDLSKYKSLINLDLRHFHFKDKLVNENHKLLFLNLYNTNIASLSNTFCSLKILNLRNSKFNNFKSIKLPSLKKLYLRSTKITNLNDIKYNCNLNLLDIGHTDISCLEPLKEIKLNYLFVDCTKINRLSEIYTIKFINLRKISNLDIFNIDKFINIKHIDLRSTKFNNFDMLKKLGHNVIVYLNSSFIKNLDITIDISEYKCKLFFSN